MTSLPPTLAVTPLLRYRRLTLPLEGSVQEARKLFARHPRLYHLPVVDAEGHYRWLLPKKALARQKPEALILSLSLKEVPALSPQATIYDALQTMHAYHTPEVPVTDPENHYLGLLTADSLIQWSGPARRRPRARQRPDLRNRAFQLQPQPYRPYCGKRTCPNPFRLSPEPRRGTRQSLRRPQSQHALPYLHHQPLRAGKLPAGLGAR